MITLSQIADNIQGMMYPNTLTLEGEISTRQIKHWIHYHRAKLISDNIDKGILNDESLYQKFRLTTRNSTNSALVEYMKEHDEGNSPTITEGMIKNYPRFSGGQLTGEWLVNSSMTSDTTGSQQAWQDSQSRNFYGEETSKSQVRGDFRNFGYHSFWTPRPLQLKNDEGIKKISLERYVHFPDDPDTAANEQSSSYAKKAITLPRKEYGNDEYNKFTDYNKPHYIQSTSSLNSYNLGGENSISLRRLQVSPNYHGGLKTPDNKKLFWKYRASVQMILENPTEVDIMGGLWYDTEQDWNDSTTPYPIAMEYVNDLIQRVTQQESLYSLKTMASE